MSLSNHNYLARWDTGRTTLVDAAIVDDGSVVTILRAADVASTLDVRGTLSVWTNNLRVMNTNILFTWIHTNIVTNLNADLLDGWHATNLPYMKPGDETDPQVGIIANNYVPRWNVTNLVTGSIYNDPAGNIGIGKTGPTAPLSFANVTGKKIYFYDDGTFAHGIDLQAGLLRMFAGASADSIAFGYESSDVFNEWMRIKAGNVGIGTANPTSGYKLDVAGPVLLDAYDNAYTGGLSLDRSYPVHGSLWVDADGGTLLSYMGYYGHKWETASWEQMRLTSGGNLGIGTANPLSRLEVNGNIGVNGAIRFLTAPSGDGYLAVDSGRTLRWRNFNSGSPNWPAVTFETGNGIFNSGVEIRGDNTDGRILFHDPGDYIYSMGIDYSDGRKFKINRWNLGDNNDFTLDTAGNVGIGISPAYKLDVNGHAMVRGTVRISGGDYRIQTDGTPDGYPHFLALIARPGADATVLVPPFGGFYVTDHINQNDNMWVTDRGEVKARLGFYLISDDRVKFNEQELNYGLAQIMALEPKRYDRAEYELDPETEELVIHPEKTRTEIGLVAQELQKVIPEAISIPEDENRELWSMSYDTIVPVLVKAIQEQQAMIESLQQRIETLEQK